MEALITQCKQRIKSNHDVITHLRLTASSFVVYIQQDCRQVEPSYMYHDKHKYVMVDNIDHYPALYSLARDVDRAVSCVQHHVHLLLQVYATGLAQLGPAEQVLCCCACDL